MTYRPILTTGAIDRDRCTWQHDAELPDNPPSGPRRYVSVFFRSCDVELYGCPDSLRQAADELRAIADAIEAARP